MFAYYLRLAHDLAQAQPRAHRADGRRDRARHRHVDDLADRAAHDVGQPAGAQERASARVAARQLGCQPALGRRQPDRAAGPDDLPDVRNLVAAHKAEHEAGFFPNVLSLEPAQREIKPYMVDGAVHDERLLPDVRAAVQVRRRLERGRGPQRRARGGASTRRPTRSSSAARTASAASCASAARTTPSSACWTKWHPTPQVYHISGGAFDDPQAGLRAVQHRHREGTRSSSNNSCCEDRDDPGYQGLLGSECIWMDLWVQVKDEADAQRYLSFLNNYVAEQKKIGRFPRPLNNRLRSVSEWLVAQRVVSRDARTQVWLAFALLRGVPDQHRGPAAGQVHGQGAGDRPAPRASAPASRRCSRST